MNTNVDSQSDEAQRTPNSPRPKSRLRRWSTRLVLFAGGLYLGIVILLLASETSLVYPGSKYPRGDWEPKAFAYEEVKFESSDGTALYGWFLPKSESDEPRSGDAEIGNDTDSQQTSPPDDSVEPANPVPPSRVVLLCHGNAENIAQSARNNGVYFRDALCADVFVFDYRGFGKSEGVPDEQGVLADSEAALKWLCEHMNRAPTEIILVGHSIGGGPAVHLAAQHGCKTLVLQRTFSRLTDPAQHMYPWIPVSYLMRNQYPSTEKIATCSAPVFQSHGDADRLIPIQFAKKLFTASPAKKKVFFEVPGMTHWDHLPDDYWTDLEQFITEIESGQ